MRTVTDRAGLAMPVLGQGTWEMGVDPRHASAEADALRLGLDLGLTLVDTAELYGSGGAERVVARAIDGRRDEVFLVSKVLPDNASFAGTIAAAERSLERLRTDRLDLYLLHWPGAHPLEATYAAFARLVEQGKIRAYGVSNFDPAELARAEALPGGAQVAANQVLYNLRRRGPERRLIPWCRERRITVMAYSPLDQGRLGVTDELRQVARQHGATPQQIAIAWTMREPGLVTIPKAARPEHVRANVAAAAIVLGPDELAVLDRAYPVPERDAPLETA